MTRLYSPDTIKNCGLLIVNEISDIHNSPFTIHHSQLFTMPNYWPEEEGGIATEQEQQQKVDKPRLYKVLLHNDNYTTMEFVVMVLIAVFHKSEAEAVRIMLDVHHNGIGIAGVYQRDIAETKVQRVLQLAQEAQFPLMCSMEPE